jgi:GNAT superfamily N-acetyltransferase
MVLALNATDVGSRVVVRRRVGPLYTDLLGELQEITADAVVVLTAKGQVRVPMGEIHRAKKIPENPIARLEKAATAAWPPAELDWLGQWRLRVSGGYTGRANSALALGDPGLPLPEAYARIDAFYRAHGLPPRVDIPLPLSARAVPAAVAAGWTEECEVLVQALPLGRLVAVTPPGTGCSLDPEPTAAALTIIAGRRGPLPEAAMHVLTAVETLAFAHYVEEGELLAMGRGAVTDGYLGLFAIETIPAARRRGLAQEILGRLARWGAEVGAHTAYLQVESTNAAAIALYGKLGFRTHHRYVRYSRAD